MCNFFSVCVSESSLINDNELYFRGPARLMEEKRPVRIECLSQLFYLCVSCCSYVDLLLSSHETSLDSDSFQGEQKHIYFIVFALACTDGVKIRYAPYLNYGMLGVLDTVVKLGFSYKC